MSESPQQVETLLNDRYGKERGRSIDKRVAWITVAVLVLAGIIFLFFSGWQEAKDVEFKTISYEVIDGSSVNVQAQVTVPKGSEAICAFEALSESFATVGWKLVELPATDALTRSFETKVITTSPSTTGSIRECWVVTETE